MYDLMRLLPTCPYAGKCSYPCTVTGKGTSHPLLFVKPAEKPGEMVVSCANFRKEAQYVDSDF